MGEAENARPARFRDPAKGYKGADALQWVVSTQSLKLLTGSPNLEDQITGVRGTNVP